MPCDQMGGRIGVDCIIFAETKNATSISAEIERVDTEMSPSAVALDLFGN
jgi:hypothetical protein